jgi:hypothetical protein
LLGDGPFEAQSDRSNDGVRASDRISDNPTFMGLSTSHREHGARTSYDASPDNFNHFNYYISGNAHNYSYFNLHCFHHDFHIDNHFHQYYLINQLKLYVHQEFDADEHDYLIFVLRDRYKQHRPD